MNILETVLDRVDGSTGSVRSAAEHVLSPKNDNYKDIVAMIIHKIRTVGLEFFCFVFKYLHLLFCRLRHSKKCLSFLLSTAPARCFN